MLCRLHDAQFQAVHHSLFVIFPSRIAMSAPLDIRCPPPPYLVSRGYDALVEGFPESLPELAMHCDVACSFGRDFNNV